MARLASITSFAALALVAVAQQDVTIAPTNWTTEGGSVWREGTVGYDGSAGNTWAQARFFYYPLSAGSTYCSKNQPDTASATPLMYLVSARAPARAPRLRDRLRACVRARPRTRPRRDVLTPPPPRALCPQDTWIVCDCANNIVGLANPDKDLVSSGGLLTALWTWKPSSAGLTFDTSPTLATPFIDASWTTPTMYVLYKGQTSSPMLFALNLVKGGSVVPTLKWKLDLGALNLPQNDQGQLPIFQTFSEDHSIIAYGGKVWVPSQDYAGALLVDGQQGPAAPLLTTASLYYPTQRLRGSVGGAGMNWRAPVFVAHGSGYGIQSFSPDSGNRSWWSNNRFNAYANEFSHPVAVSFWSFDAGATNCVIVSQWDQTGDIFLSGANANSSGPCGFWDRECACRSSRRSCAAGARSR